MGALADQMARFADPVFRLGPLHTRFPHLTSLMQHTWFIAVLAWFGLRLLFRAPGPGFHVGGSLLAFGAVWVVTMALYTDPGASGLGAVYLLALVLVMLGCVVRFLSAAVHSASTPRSWRL